MIKSVLKFIILIVLTMGISLCFTQVSPWNLFKSIPVIAYTPKAVYVYKPFKRVLMAEGRNKPQILNPGKLIAYERKLFIPGTPKKGNGATLGFVAQEDNQKKTDHLAAAGFSTVGSTYYYPCKYRGSFTIGWKPGTNNNCSEITYGSIKTIIGPAAKPKLLDEEELARSDEIRDYEWEEFYKGASVHRHQYCSAANKSGKGWSIKLAPYWRTPDSPTKDICEAAIEDCQKKIGDTCFITGRGDWRDYDPNRTQLNLLLQCADGRLYHRQGDGINVYGLYSDLEQEARKAGATSCTFNIYRNDEVLISPSSEQRTLICTEPTEKGFAIHDLVGAVTIRPPGAPKAVKTVSLQPKQSYVFINTTNQGTQKELSEEQRKAIVELPVVQAFLDGNNWSADLYQEIEEYHKAVQDQFHKPPAPPAVQVEETVVNGVPIWKTTIDLNNPETLVTLVPKADVAKAGGLARFAKSKNAAIIASGTYGDEKGKSTNVWTMKSEGRFIGYIQNSERWSTGTVLGLKRGNQAEMVARAKTPQWDQYWFALTGHPRLVSNGVAGVTEVAPGETLNTRGSAGRAAIGFSSKTKTLYHVITKENISLDRLAKVMLSIGCDEAMNLEGGNGRVLARKGTPLVSGEVRSPLIVVYDAQNPPPQSISDNWTSFHASDRPSVSDR